MDYDRLKEEVISAFGDLYKIDLAFDYARVPKEMRVKMLEDPDIQAEINHSRAALFRKQLKTLNSVIDEEYSTENRSSAPDVLKALEMKNKLLFDDLGVQKDDSKALNIFFLPMTAEDYKKMETVEIHKPRKDVDIEKLFDEDE